MHITKTEEAEARDPEFLLASFVKGDLDAGYVGYEGRIYVDVVKALEEEIDEI